MIVEPLSYPEVIPLSYLLDGSVWRQVCHWIDNGIKTWMGIVSLVVLFRANIYHWTLKFGEQRKSLPRWYYQAITYQKKCRKFFILWQNLRMCTTRGTIVWSEGSIIVPFQQEPRLHLLDPIKVLVGKFTKKVTFSTWVIFNQLHSN